MKNNKLKLSELDSQMRLSAEEIEKINGGFAIECKSCMCCCKADSVEEFKIARKAGKKLEVQQEIR